MVLERRPAPVLLACQQGHVAFVVNPVNNKKQGVVRVVEDSFGEEGEAMVGSRPIRLVNQAKSEEWKHTEKC